MAHFYGTLQGQRGQASRCGSKSSGIESYTASWSGAVRCYAYVDENTGEDWVTIALSPWHGRGISKTLYDGPINGKETIAGTNGKNGGAR